MTTLKSLGGRKRVRAIGPNDPVHLSLTVPQELKAGIEKAATANGRSINVEAGTWLLGSLQRRELLKDALTLAYRDTAAVELMAWGKILRDAYAADNLLSSGRINLETRRKIQDSCRKQLLAAIKKMEHAI